VAGRFRLGSRTIRRPLRLASGAACAVALLVAAVLLSKGDVARSASGAACGGDIVVPACEAIRGDRAEGWLQQSRSEVMAQHGIVTTSQPLAAEAGLRILMQGGNAIDAAVATAATLSITEPMNVGIGGDVFAIIYTARDHGWHVLNASGMAPSGATIAHYHALGYDYDPKNWGPASGMPTGGILDVTVPGSVWGWDEALRRYGTMTFAQVLAPAADYAQNGFPVSERIAHDWRLPNALPLKGCCTQLDPDSVKTWYIDGRPPVAGQIYRNPELARAFHLLQRGGRDAFYKGSIANAIVAKSRALGGTMTLSDLANYRGEWVTPAISTYHGYEIVELPPPSQGFATNEALNILEQCVPKLVPGQTLQSLGPRNATYWHLLIEAKKLAYADLYRYNGDPDVVSVPLSRLLSPDHASSLCAKIDPAHASSTQPPTDLTGAGDTVVLSTADRWGNMVSWVNSNYSGFGSGITVPGYGFILHNRGGLFSLDPKSPDAIAPHKRPFNTLAAGFIRRNGAPMMTIGLMGGAMQAQGHEQVVVDMLDLRANVQEAGDMARFYHDQVSNTLSLETPLYDLVGAQLASMGHRVRSTNRAPMGGYQAIFVEHRPDGTVYRAGSDFGKDGEAVGW
jgi:gamma-glutamyltranspeptidase/glutathione hydrolase